MSLLKKCCKVYKMILTLSNKPSLTFQENALLKLNSEDNGYIYEKKLVDA